MVEPSGNRTADLLIANEALSQLSYGPSAAGQTGRTPESAAIYVSRPRSSQERLQHDHLAGFSALCGGRFPCSAKAKPIFWRRNSDLRFRTREQIKPMRAILDIILIALDLYVWLLIASAILSWLIAFNVVNTRNQFVAGVAEFLYRITEPALRPIRSAPAQFRRPRYLADHPDPAHHADPADHQLLHLSERVLSASYRECRWSPGAMPRTASASRCG